MSAVPELPPTRRRSDAAGTLVLIGGASTPQGAALRTFVERSGAGHGGRIVGLTAGAADPTAAALAWKEDLALAGARNVEIPIVDRRDRAQDPRIAEMVLAADGIFLGGGDQVLLLSRLGGSRVGRAIAAAYARGAVVCGTSAGAAALSETVLAGDEPDTAGDVGELHLGPGFGLLGFSSVVDTHFSRRGRLQRLFRRVAENPELLGLGIDEDTAFVVRGHLGEVVGRGSLIFVDGRGVRYDNAEAVRLHGAPLTMSYLRVGVVGAGHLFNLRERELEVLVQARTSGEETPTVRGEDAPASGAPDAARAGTAQAGAARAGTP